MIDLLSILEKLTRTLDKARIEFALIGGLALAYYVEPRATMDIDILVSVNDKSEPKLREIMIQRGFVDANPRPLVLKKVIISRMFHVQQNEWIIIDIMWVNSDLHRCAIKRANKVKLNRHTVRVLRPEDLILLKSISARPQDLADIQKLQHIPTLDRKYLTTWSKKLKLKLKLDS